MLFNSIEFLLFFPIVVMLYFAIPHRYRWVLLLAASYIFYMFWKPEYIILIIFSTLVDYYAGLMMDRHEDKKRRKKYLLLSLLVNLGLLFLFKYFNFFNAELGRLYSIVSHQDYSIGSLRILLPMGISFYTFQTLSYSIDVYRGKRKAEKHFGYFALYVTFFPQLVAGPIERSDRLLPQLREKHAFSYDNLMDGILRMCWGFFKKIVIADRVAALVNIIYGNLYDYNGIYLIIATIGFAIQIYCDFSGYSDIAIGAARIMGIDLMENFKMPYFSKSINEFWTRWHISLSTWFKDYLYIPLGGNRTKTKAQYYRNIMIVFLVSGFWHGAEWTFLIWGFLHGAVQIMERVFKNEKLSNIVPGFAKQVLTLLFVCFAWIFFRADNISDAAYIITHVGIDGARGLINALLNNATYNILHLDKADIVLLTISTLILLIYDGLRYKKQEKKEYSYFAKGLLAVVMVTVVVIFGYYGANQSSQFIYFQF